MFSIGYLIIFGVFMLLSWLVSYQLKSRFKKYSTIMMNRGMTGKDVAEKMLRDNGIYDVQVVSVEGELTDHYNPANKTVNLSRGVFYGNHVAAGAVAAHECGHAVQHANAYAWLSMRSSLVPVVSFASNWVQWVLLAGVLLLSFGVGPTILLIGIILFGFTTLFSFITLPVEVNASSRALVWLENAGVTSFDTHDKAKDALRWAAYTYVIAALGSLATLLYYIWLYLGARD
jgi:Zn-dependent membrane protease YugP